MKTGSGDTSRSSRSASSAVQSTVRNVVTCGIAATSVSRRGDLATHGGDGLDAGESGSHPLGGVQVLDRDPPVGPGAR